MSSTRSQSHSQRPARKAFRAPPLWVSCWFAFSTVVVLWDAGYCFMRPRSMPGGDLSWIWAPYNMVPYAAIDLVYGFKALEDGDGFTNAQALMNIFEVILNLEFLYLRHTPQRSSRSRPHAPAHAYHPHAPVLGLVAAIMTCAKTSLYFWQDYYCSWCMSGHNSRRDFWQYYVAPNVVWVVMPGVVAIVLGGFISDALKREYATQVAYDEFEPRELEVDSKVPATSASTSTTASALLSTNKESSCLAATKARSRSRGRPSNISTTKTPVPPRIGLSPAPKALPVTIAETPFPVPKFGAGLPLTFQPHGQTCIVIGTNRLAATRALAMLEADAKVIIASESSLTEAVEELRYREAKGEVEYHQIDNDWKGFFESHRPALVCVTDTLIGSSRRSDLSVDSIASAAEEMRIPINISDHPALSTYSFPSVHRFNGVNGPSSLQLAVSTNAKGCRLSTRIKRDVVAKLPASIGAAVDNVGLLRDHARTMEVSDDDVETPLNSPVPQLDTPSLLEQATSALFKGTGGGSGVSKDKEETGGQLRRMRWVHQMSEYYSYDALARITPDEMEGALTTWRGGELPHHDGTSIVGSSSRSTSSSRKRKGEIYLVGSGPGHPGLLTVAALHVFRTATVILSDKLVPAEILALIPSATRLHIAKKFPGNNEGAQNEMMELSLAAARQGEIVVRLKQGDPFVYGRGGEEVLYFRQHGFEAAVIPGVSSALAGPLMMGIPVTQRGVAESMVLCTGVGRAGKSVQLPGYIRSRSLALLMGVARIKSIVEVMCSVSAPGRDGARYPRYLPIAVIERASSPDQRAILTTLEHVEDALRSMEERPPGMMLVGWAVLALEGTGRVDVLDTREEEEEGIVREWMGGKRWKVVEGLGEGWRRLEGVVSVE